MSQCYKCETDMVISKRLICAEPNVVRKNPELMRNEEALSQHQCHNFGCGVTWYSCDKSCQKNFSQYHRSGRSTKQCHFARRSNLVKHLRKYHSRCEKEKETANECCANVNTLQMEDVNLIIGETLNIEFPIDTGETIERMDGFYWTENDFTDQNITTVGTDQHSTQIHPQEFRSTSLNSHLDNCKKLGYSKAVTILICRAAYQTKTVFEEEVPSPWVAAFITITRIVLLSKDEARELLSSILIFLNRIIRVCLSPLKMYPRMPLPLSTKDFQSMILNPTNTHSIKSILPMPDFKHSPNTEHCIVPLTELVGMTMFMPSSQSLSDGISLRFRSTVKSESFYERRNRIPQCYREGNTVVPSVLAYIILWSDGWDPNRSNKSNRHPVWTATGTIILVELGKEDNPYMSDTVLLGAGPGKVSHEEFFDMLVMEKTTKWEDCNGRLAPLLFYSKHHNKEVHVFISLGVALQDNPERRGCAYLLGGNSNIHGIFGVTCDFKELDIPFIACDDCEAHLKDYVGCGDFTYDSTNNECTKCLGWSIDKLCSKGMYKKPLSPDGLLLQETDFGYDRILRPMRLSFEDCISAWNYAISKYVEEGSWTATKTKSYLKLFCCNDEITRSFIEQARLYLNIKGSTAMDAHLTFEAEDLERFRSLSFTPQYCLPKHPAIWLLFNIHDITELPMHLPMGTTKALLRSILTYTSCRDRKQEFIRRCNEILQTVQGLRIDVVPVLRFRDEKFGGFVAENYSAMMLLLPWLSCILEESIMEPTTLCVVSDLAKKRFDKWTGKECKAWLVERGIEGHSSSPAAVVKKLVWDYLHGEPDNIPEKVPNPGRLMQPEMIRSLIMSANSVFTTIMLTDYEGMLARHRSQALIGLFFSQYEHVDKILWPNRKDSIWISKYNMLGLLRVPEHFLRHRHFRNQYEGGMVGEGMVKELRSHCPDAVRDGWSRNVIKKFYHCKSLDSICQEVSWTNWSLFQKPLLGSVIPTISPAELRNFRRYRNMDDIHQSLSNGHPISVVVYTKTNHSILRFACVLRVGILKWAMYFFRCTIDDIVYIDPNGFSYFSVELNSQGIQTNGGSLQIPGYQFNSFGIMLPDLWNSKVTSTNYCKYSIVNADGARMNCIGEWTSHL